MRRVSLLAALALPLAACGSGGPTVTATNASMSEVQAKVAAANDGGAMISPGRWEGSMTMHNVQMPNMDKLPPAMRDKLAARMSAAKPFVSCVTEEQIKARHGLFTGNEAAKNCRYDHFTMAGGKIDSAMSCDMPTAKMAMKMTGTYSPDSYHIDADTTTSGASAATAGMSMSMTIDSKRVGACRGTPDEH